MSSELASSSTWSHRLYSWRWPLAVLLFGGVLAANVSGWSWVEDFSKRVDSLRDADAAASGPTEPKMFDTRYDLWFHPKDVGLGAYKTIEEEFIAEDFVLIAFSEPDHPLGVFSPESLSAIRRLTTAIERVPYVRRVRSLTSNPWIRWDHVGLNPDTGEREEGLVVSDLFVEEPSTYSEADVTRRLIGILGAERASALIGADKVRRSLGDISFDDAIGEPRLMGSIVSDDGRTTALQVQVLRPPIDDAKLTEVFGDDEKARIVGPSMFANDAQWSALDGIYQVIREEQGLSVRSEEAIALEAEIAAMPEGAEKDLLAQQLRNPALQEVIVGSGDGQRVISKFRQFERGANGNLTDISNPEEPKEVADGFESPAKSKFEYHLAGMPLFMRNFQDVGMRDLQIVGFMFLTLIVVLFVAFRRVSGVVNPLLVVMGSTVGMLGAAWLMHDSLNNLTAITPNMVTAIGIADAIHLIASYYAIRRYFGDRRSLIVEVIRRNAVPVFLTSVTTAVGFFSLTTSDIIPMQMLGYTAGIGTIFAYLLSMTLVPALLSILPVKKIGDEPPPAGPPQSDERSARYVDMILRWRKPILALSAVIAVVSAIGMYRISIDSDFRTMFPDDNAVMQDFAWIEQRLGGAGDLELVFEAAPVGETADEAEARRLRLEELQTRQVASADGIAGFEALSSEESAELLTLLAAQAKADRSKIAISGEFLSQMQRFEDRLREEMAKPDSPMQVVTKISGPLDVLRKIHQVQHENRGTEYRVPKESDIPEELRKPTVTFDEILEEAIFVPGQNATTMAGQYYLQYENGAKPTENLSTLVSPDRTLFRVQGRVRQARSELQEEAFNLIEEIARNEFPLIAGSAEAVANGDALSTMTVSGKTVLYASMTKKFSISLIKSLSIALALITILIGVIYRSITYAFLSIVPNVMPIVLPLSIFGLLGWDLDGPAIIVASVALGVCVDDTIHFLTKFTRARKRGLDVTDSLSTTFRDVGPALTITSIVLVLGFGVLSFSQFTPNRLMGQLAVAMIALAWVADFVVTPALLSLIPEKNKTTGVSAAKVEANTQPAVSGRN